MEVITTTAPYINVMLSLSLTTYTVIIDTCTLAERVKDLIASG